MNDLRIFGQVSDLVDAQILQEVHSELLVITQQANRMKRQGCAATAGLLSLDPLSARVGTLPTTPCVVLHGRSTRGGATLLRTAPLEDSQLWIPNGLIGYRYDYHSFEIRELTMVILSQPMDRTVLVAHPATLTSSRTMMTHR
jgi:hypothetical protein